MLQLILHLIGDYVLQSDWMAQRKTKHWFPALCHSVVYSLPFLLITSSYAWFVIFSTHYFIDRYRLARYVVYAKNFLAPRDTYHGMIHDSGGTRHEWTDWWHEWKDCSATGYHKDSPLWLSVWLLIAADNTIHLLINYLSIEFLG